MPDFNRSYLEIGDYVIAQAIGAISAETLLRGIDVILPQKGSCGKRSRVVADVVEIGKHYVADAELL